jgi:hypothetical protein
MFESISTRQPLVWLWRKAVRVVSSTVMLTSGRDGCASGGVDAAALAIATIASARRGIHLCDQVVAVADVVVGARPHGFGTVHLHEPPTRPQQITPDNRDAGPAVPALPQLPGLDDHPVFRLPILVTLHLQHEEEVPPK